MKKLFESTTLYMFLINMIIFYFVSPLITNTSDLILICILMILVDYSFLNATRLLEILRKPIPDKED